MNKAIDNIKLLFKPQTLFGIVVSILGVYWAFRDFHFDDFISTIGHIDYKWVVIATVSLLASVGLRALRWQYLFKETDGVETYPLFRYELIGYFGNNVLPLRLGEVLRAYILGKRYALSKSYVFGTIILERILDTASLVILAGTLLLIFPLNSDIKTYIYIGFGAVAVFLVIMIFLKRLHLVISEGSLWRNVTNFIEGFRNIQPERLPVIFILSIIIWLVYWLDVHLIQMAFKLDMAPSQSLLLLIISSLVISIPSAPGMIGTFHAGVKYVMVGLLGFSPDLSNTFAIVLHAYGYIAYTVVGAIYFMKSQFHKNAISEVLQK